MASITIPLNTAPIAVQPGQALRLTADASVAWSYRLNEGSWTAITTAASIVFTTPTSVTNRWTFDRIEIAIGSTASPDDTRDFNLCEGPPAVQWATAQLQDPTQDPSPNPNLGEGDDPPHALAWRLPGANRDGFATESPERAHVAGGPVTLLESFRGGIFVDSAGKVGARSTLLGRVSGLGPFPESALYHHGGTYFEHDFGKGRTIGLTRVLLEDGDGNVAVVRGDGRRNTYRFVSTTDGVTTFESAAGLRTTLQKLAGWGNQPWGISPYGGGTCFVEEAPSGRRFVYAEDGRLTHVLDRYGNLVVYRYDANDRLQKIESDPAGGSGLVPYLCYDGSGRLSRLVFEDALEPANNRTTYFSYDGAGNLQRLTGPEGCETYFVYGGTGSGFLTRAEDADGFAWEVGYQSDVASAVVDGRGNHAYFAFDTGAARATKVDRAGTVTYMDFDAFGAPIGLSNPGTAEDVFAYDGEGGLLSTANRLGNAWSFERDERGNRISVTDPLGARTYFAFDAVDSVRTAIDPLGRVSYFSYDSDRNRTVAVDALDQATYFTWSGAGLLETRTDRRGAVTSLSHDARANLTQVTDPLGNATYFAFNSAGEPIEHKDALLRTTTIERDLKGRVETQVDPIGAASYFAYDARCNLVSQKDALLRETNHVYDGNSNRTLTLQPTLAGERFATYFGWDEEDRPERVIDALGRPTYFAYDALGRRESQTDAFFGVREFAYDAAHELSAQTDERGNPTYLRYDVVGRTSHQQDALLQETYLGYDLKGNHVMTLPPGLTVPTVGIFWTDSTLDTIKRADADGSNVATVVSSGLSVPRGIVVHAGLGVMYWIDSGNDTIKRAKLDGNDEVTLVSAGLSTPRDLVADFGAGQLYWIDSGNDTIKRSELDGSGVVTVLSLGAGTPEGLAIDPEGGKLYWTDSANQTIRRCDLDGTDAETLVTSTHVSAPSGIALDLDAGHVIWTDPGNDTIKRADLDGGNVTTLVSSGLQTPRGIAVDPIGQKLYWVDAGTDKVQRSELDGSDVTDLVTSGLSAPEGIALELPARVTTIEVDDLDRPVAVTDAIGAVRQSVFDPESNLVRSIDPLGKTTYFTFDLAGRQTHVEDQLGNVTYMGYDRASQQVLALDALGFPTYFRFDAAGRQTHVTNAFSQTSAQSFDLVGNLTRTLPPSEAVRIWWTDSGSDTLSRAKLDGSDATAVVSSGLQVPRGLEVDAAAGHVYWLDSGTDTIKRCDLDGGNLTTLVSTGLSTPRDLALDLEAGHMYWTDSGNDTIKRADLDGTNVTTLVSSGLDTPEGIALDLVAGKIYWTDSGSDTINRCELDGTGAEAIVSSGLASPSSLAVDPIGEKVYWVDSGTDKLQRCDLDGSNVEDLVTTGLVTARGVALDLAARKVYWIDSGNDTVKRANLDGTGVETLISSGLDTPEAIALEVPVRERRFSYDALDRQVQVEDAYGNVAETVFDRVGNVLRSIDERGTTSYFSYDRLNRQTHREDSVDFAPTYMGYDAVGNMVVDVDALGFASYFTFDVLNRVSFAHDRAGALSYHAFDEVSNEVQNTVLLGAGGERRDTYFRFDPANRRTHVQDALGGVAYMGFDLASNQVLSVDPVGRPSYFDFDLLNRQEARRNFLDETWSRVFTARSEVEKEVDPVGRTTYFLYDRLGRQAERSNLLGETTYMGFDARGNEVLRVNPRGYPTYFALDLLDRRSQQQDALGGVRYFGFDAVGNGVLRLDELGNPSYFEFDGARRLIRATDAAQAHTYMEYDARGAVTKKLSAAAAAGTTYMAYDAAGRLEVEWFAKSGGGEDQPIYFSYDEVGNLTGVIDDSGADTVQEWDKLDRLTKKVTVAGPVYFEYDQSGIKRVVKNPALEKTSLVYDEAARLHFVAISAGGVRRHYYTYDASGMPLTKIHQDNKVMAYYSWDDAGRLEQLQNLDQNAAVLSYFSYERNALGAVTQIRHEAGGWSYFEFDALDRLTHEERVGSSSKDFDKSFVYDAASNRIREDEGGEHTYYAYDERNLLQQTWGLPTAAASYFSYDDAQRMTEELVVGGQSTYFSFDQRDEVTRLEFARATDPDSTRVMVYSGTGERVYVEDGSGAFNQTYWSYDGSKLLMERKADGDPARTYRHDDSSFAMDESRLGSLLEFDSEILSKAYYACADELANVVDLVDAGDGSADGSYSYDAFAELIQSSVEADNRLRARTMALVGLSLTNEQVDLTRTPTLYLPGLNAVTSRGAAKAEVSWRLGGSPLLDVLDPPCPTGLCPKHAAMVAGGCGTGMLGVQFVSGLSVPSFGGPPIFAAAAVAGAIPVPESLIWREVWKRASAWLAKRGIVIAGLACADGPLPFGDLLALGLGFLTAIDLILLVRHLYRAVRRHFEAAAAAKAAEELARHRAEAAAAAAVALPVPLDPRAEPAGPALERVLERLRRLNGMCEFYLAWCLWANERPAGDKGKGWKRGAECAVCYATCKRTAKWPFSSCPFPPRGPRWEGNRGGRPWPKPGEY
ncbi:MAG: SMP-30/gluconolactonase/LRE family protein [Vicinamibacteria bacterium]